MPRPTLFAPHLGCAPRRSPTTHCPSVMRNSGQPRPQRVVLPRIRLPSPQLPPALLAHCMPQLALCCVAQAKIYGHSLARGGEESTGGSVTVPCAHNAFIRSGCVPPEWPSPLSTCPLSSTFRPVAHLHGCRCPMPRRMHLHLQLHAAEVARVPCMDNAILPASRLWESLVEHTLRSTPCTNYRPRPSCQLSLCGGRRPRALPRAWPMMVTRPPLPPPCACR